VSQRWASDPVQARPATRLLLVRHGETEWNVARRFQGQQDSSLTERGRWQSARLAERLRTLPMAAIYSSDLGRTLETAHVLAAPHGLPVQPAPALREGAFGRYEGATFTELVERYGDVVTRWASDPVELAPPEGETLRSLQERVAGFVRSLVDRHPGETVLLVAHGGSVRAAVMEVLRMDLRRFRSLRMDNASLSIIESDGAFDRLLLFNDTSHLNSDGAELS
jgi:broad specificity phosphatase PhoE